MKRRWGMCMRALAVVLALTASYAGWASDKAASVQESEKRLENAQAQLKATFSQLQFEEIRESEVPGIVEIYAGPRIFYFAPEQKILIFGEMYSAGGASLTDEKLQKYVARRVTKVDRTSALTLGDGSTEVIAFVDPDCGHCRNAYKWFREKNFANVTHRVFFASTATRPGAHARVLRAVCAKDGEREELLNQAFEGGDKVLPTLATGCEGGEERLAAQAKVANDVGVFATPTFMVKGQVITGFDRARLESLITGKDQ